MTRWILNSVLGLSESQCRGAQTGAMCCLLLVSVGVEQHFVPTVGSEEKIWGDLIQWNYSNLVNKSETDTRYDESCPCYILNVGIEGQGRIVRVNLNLVSKLTWAITMTLVLLILI